jgi:hypothetical protein
MSVVAKRLKQINTLALWAIIAQLAVPAALPATAAPAGSAPPQAVASPEPVLILEAPAGHCAYDASKTGKPTWSTGFEPGLKSGTELVALYVPCVALQAVRSGTAEWLPEWVAIEKNTVTYPSDDERSLGSHGAVKRLCEDAQSSRWGHPRYMGEDFATLVQKAGEKLSSSTPVVFLGVIGEDEHACYLSAVRVVNSPSGKPLKFLIVTAFMQAGDRWVTQSFRRELQSTRDGAEAVLTSAKKESKSFSDKNR